MSLSKLAAFLTFEICCFLSWCFTMASKKAEQHSAFEILILMFFVFAVTYFSYIFIVLSPKATR